MGSDPTVTLHARRNYSSMKITKKTIQLISELEYIIGDECYNPHSYNGWTGEEGLSFRYPVQYRNKSGEMVETRWHAPTHEIDPKDVIFMHYKLGANHLYIGNALIRVLKHLEENYGLNIDELVKQKK